LARVQAAVDAFAGRGTFDVHVHPYQLYPQLKRGVAAGVDRGAFYDDIARGRRPDETDDDRAARRRSIGDAYARDGLPGPTFAGRLGSSFDAQRLVWYAKLRGCEAACAGAALRAAHAAGRCLSDEATLLDVAVEAGLDRADAAAFLASDRGCSDVAARIRSYYDHGIWTTPVVVFDNKFPLFGAVDASAVRDAVEQLLDIGEVDAAMPAAHSSQTT